MLKAAQKNNIGINNLFKKIPFLNKILIKNKKEQDSQNYQEMVNKFIVKVKKN